MIALLALLIGPGLAAEEAPRPLPGWRELYAELRELQQQVGGPVALATPGREARGLGRRVAGLFAAGEVVLRPVPLVGDPQAELALVQKATGLSCVAWLSPAGPEADPEGWILQPLGDCGAVTPVTDTPTPPPLLRFVPRSGQPPYRVVDEQGRGVDPWRFASLTRDPNLRDRLISERRRRRHAARALELGGAAIFASAAIPLLEAPGVSADRAEDRRFTAMFLATTGIIAFVGGRLDRRGLEARQAEVGNYVHPVDAAASIEDHNARAREQRRARQAAEAAQGSAVPPAEERSEQQDPTP